MSKFKKPLSLVLAFVLVVAFSSLVFSGSRINLGNKVTLRCAFWGDTSEIAIIKNSVERFKKANPGIDVKLERLPAGDPYTEKILTQIAGGNPVDVMFVNAEQFINYASKGILLPLNSYVEKEKFPIDRFYKRIINKFSINGQLYVLPRDIAPVCVVYYNKELFDKAGLKYPKDNWNWNDLVSMGKKLTQKQEDGTTVFGFADDWGIWDAWVLSNGGAFVDNLKKPTKCTLDSKEALSALQFRQDLIYKYKVMPSPSQLTAMGGVGSSEMFMQGHAAMFLSGIWKTPFFRNIQNFKWDAVMFPKGPKGTRGFFLSGGGYAALKTTKHPEEAWKLLTFLSGEEGQKELARTGLAQPAMMDIAKSKDFLDGQPPASKAFLLEAAEIGSFGPDTVRWQEALSSYVYPALDKVWANEAAPAEVMTKAVKEINKNIFPKEKKK